MLTDGFFYYFCSENRSKELINEIDTLINKYGGFTEVNQILNDISWLSQLHRKNSKKEASFCYIIKKPPMRSKYQQNQ